MPVALMRRLSRGVELVAEVVADRRGIASFERTERLKDPVPEGLFVRLGVVGSSPGESETAVAGRSWAETPIRAAAPPFGHLLVALIGPGEAPYLEPAQVAVSRSEHDETHGAGRPELSEGGDEVIRTIASTKPGTALFNFVRTGAPPRIVAVPKDALRRRGAVEAEGPSASGEGATVVVRCGGHALTFEGRVVSGVGAAKEGLYVYVQPIAAMESGSKALFPVLGGSARTAADGGFRVTLDRDPAAFVGRESRVIVGDYGSPTTGNVRQGPPDSRGVVALGDVVVASDELIAEGVVLDVAGRPIAGARVRSYRQASGEDSNRAAGRPPSLMPDWNLQHLSVNSDSEGRFAIRGAPVAQDAADRKKREFHWGAASDRYFLVEAPIADSGARGLRIVMERGGSLEGSVLVDAVTGEIPAGLQITDSGPPIYVTVDLGWRNDENEIVMNLDEERRFSVNPLRPGRATVSIRLVGRHKPLFEIADIEIRAGEPAKDPRLVDIDLSEFGAVRTVRVVDEAGAPVKEAVVRLHDPESAVWGTQRADATGTARCRTFVPSSDIYVLAPGKRGATYMNVTEDFTATLRSATPCKLVIKLDEAVPLPATPYSLGVAVNWSRDRGANEGAPRPDDAMEINAVFGADRTLTLSLPEPGVYGVRSTLGKDDGVSRSVTWLDELGRVKVGPEDRSVEFSATLDPKMLEQRIKNF